MCQMAFMHQEIWSTYADGHEQLDVLAADKVGKFCTAGPARIQGCAKRSGMHRLDAADQHRCQDTTQSDQHAWPSAFH